MKDYTKMVMTKEILGPGNETDQLIRRLKKQNKDKESVWLVVHYDWEDSDVVAVCKTRHKAYEIRKEYLKKYVEEYLYHYPRDRVE